ncbi:DUF5412 family protein [Psychrobacillus sp. PGGUH221]|uniref:DUF5412 family protein n=1 Tax=Psychrobacillus sp. PGGUH221 TaxID=3020058 RepID=UPI0035C71C4C
MSKLKLLLSFFSVTILLGIIFMFQLLNPKLNTIHVNEENKEGIYISPDGEKSITVYFNGGLIFHNDVTYLGVYEDSTSDLKKNIFLVAPSVKDVRWINNEKIFVNGIEIAIDDSYDFRNE